MAFILRPLRADDLSTGLRLSQAEHWSHTAADWQLHFSHGTGFAAEDDAGALRGTALWWSYGDTIGSVGLVLVDRSVQGRGVGRALMNAIIAAAQPRALQLVATGAGVRLYEQCGFTALDSIVQLQGRPNQAAAAAIDGDMRILAVRSSELGGLCALDRSATGMQRDALLADILRVGSGFLARNDSGALTGFALCRPAGAGHTIGPVVAANETVARALIAQTLQQVPGIARLDLPGDQQALREWLVEKGLKAMEPVTLMRRGAAPATDGAMQLFGLISQALG